MARYAKAVIAVLGAAAAFLVAYNVTTPWAVAIVGAATALGVYATPNKPAPGP